LSATGEEPTRDSLLGGRIQLAQPATGYRVAIDPVMLAAAVPAADGESVLDVGTGVGAAALCLAWRVPGCKVVGIESQPALVRLGNDNAQANGLRDRVSIIIGDLLRPAPRLAPASFHHVMANPPYLPAGGGTAPPDAGKAAANVEGEARLGDWLRFCLAMARPKGGITLIYRADRLDVLLAEVRGQVGDLAILPLWPGNGRPASRVILHGRKGAGGPLRLMPGLVLHEADGRYTAAADAILREGAALPI
jgi:tRNA1(Val) A37 N6-methylase TrmN6